MCKEVFEIVKTLDLSQVEIRMALQCAPIITGIKVSNLLSIASKDEDKLRMILKKSGIISYRLLRQDDKTTFLLFRKCELETYLRDRKIQRFLIEKGYIELSLSGILSRFQQRYEIYMNHGGGFPHEMGILLGYPIEDVDGFIKEKGKNYLYSGYWKVYQNVEEKKQLFEAFESAKDGLILLVANGYELRSIVEFLQDKVNCSFQNT